MIATVALAILGQNSSNPSVAPVKTYVGLRITAAAAASTGAKIAVACEDNSIRVINSQNYQQIYKLVGHPQPAYGIAFSPDGKYLATGDETARLIVWNLSNGQKVREYPRDRGHTRGIQSIAWSANGQRIATVGKDDVIKVWAFAGGNPVGTILGSGANFYGVGFSSTGGIVTGTLLEGVRIYNPSNFTLAATVKTAPQPGSNNLSLNKAKTAAMTMGRDGFASIITLNNRQTIVRLRGHTDWILYGAFTPNGKYAFTSGSDSQIIMHNVRTGAQVMKITPSSFVGSPLAVTADGRVLVTTDDMDQLKLFTITPPQLR
ncbi:MAG: PD40 domain-containing protein [Fimbriimonadaceae bacterium]|nr:PD40 domain-containing protein [Fimbriimonadaceae bacterium]